MIKERIFKVFERLELEETLDRNTIMKGDYFELFDSITFVLLIVQLEDEFDIVIEGDDLFLDNLSSFDKIEKLVRNLIADSKGEEIIDN